MFDIDGEHGEAINVIGDTAVVENDATDDDYGSTSTATFKKPLEPLNSSSVGRPTRELISCIMTTSGFISPAREGKLPDAKKPIVILEEEPPQRPSPPPVDVKVSANDLVDKKSVGNVRVVDSTIAADMKMENPNGGEHSFAVSGGATEDSKPFKTGVPPLSIDGDNVSIKKKPKNAHGDASLKELKKAKKLSQSKSAKLPSAKNRKLKFEKALNKLLIKPSKRNALLMENAINMERDMSHLSEEEIMALMSAKKKLKMQQTIKRKYKKEVLKHGGSKQMVNADGSVSTSPQKQKKKREPKIPKRDQVNFPSTSNFAYGGGDNVPRTHHMRPYSSQEVPNVHSYGNDSSSIGVDKEESMDMTSGEHQHFDKLSNEPDKRKLNIFKKISTPSLSSNQLASQSFDSNSPIVRKSNKMHSDAAPWPSADQTPQAMTPAKMHDSTPLFSDPALLTSTPYSTSSGGVKKSKLKGLPKVPKPPKIPKEKKLKKDSTQRKPRTPKAQKTFVPPQLQAPLGQAPPDVASSRMLMPMFPNMGFLDQFSGPGLIPSNPLFQSVPFGLPGNNQMPPFSVLPSYSDLLNFSRFKRPNFDDAATAGGPIDPNRNPIHNAHNEATKDDPVASATDKSMNPLCHVAPFVPQSLLPSVGLRESASGSRTSHTDGYGVPNTNVDHAAPRHQIARGNSPLPSPVAAQRSSTSMYDDQKTTIIIDSDDDEDDTNAASNDRRLYSPATSNPAPSERDAAQFPDETKRHTKKIKEKTSTGHNKKDKKDKDGSGIKMKKKKDKKDKTKSKPTPLHFFCFCHPKLSKCGTKPIVLFLYHNKTGKKNTRTRQRSRRRSEKRRRRRIGWQRPQLLRRMQCHRQAQVLAALSIQRLIPLRAPTQIRWHGASRHATHSMAVSTVKMPPILSPVRFQS